MKKESRAEGDTTVGATLVATLSKSRASTLPHKGSLSLWLWVAAGFLFLGLLWTSMIIAIRHADTRTVPLAPREVKP